MSKPLISLPRAVLLLCLCGGFVLSAAWAAPIKIRFSYVVAEDTPKGLAVKRFQQLVAERSGGHLVVEVYPAAQLYSDHEEMEALRLGAVEMLAPSLSKFGRMGFPEFEIFDLPFLFDSPNDVKRITQGKLGLSLLRRLERQQLVGLGFLDNGFKQMSANKPLRQPSDYQGLRMRVQSSRVIAAQMQSLGARPVVLDFSETRRALAEGVVDGTENPVSNFWTQHMHEVQTDLTLTNHGYLGYAVVASQRFWQNLSQDDRELLETALAEALAYGNSISAYENDKALTALRASGRTRIHTLNADERRALRQAVQPVYQSLKRRIGEAWMQAAQAD